MERHSRSVWKGTTGKLEKVQQVSMRRYNRSVCKKVQQVSMKRYNRSVREGTT